MSIASPPGEQVAAAERTAPRRGRPRESRCDEAILNATVQILNEGGAANLSIDGVAQRAGVGKATIYRRWPSKEALVLDAMTSDRDQPVMPDTGRLRDDLEAYFFAMVERINTMRHSDVLPHLIEAACWDVTVRASLERYITTRRLPIEEALARGAARGELAASADHAIIIDALLGAVTYRRYLVGDVIDRDLVRRLLDLVL